MGLIQTPRTHMERPPLMVAQDGAAVDWLVEYGADIRALENSVKGLNPRPEGPRERGHLRD